MALSLEIGVWVEGISREINRCPSYYAADHETISTKPGQYPLRLVFETGYLIPMPYWLTASIDALRLNGALYSGCGGVNFAVTQMQPGPTTFHLQLHDYHLAENVKAGRIKLKPGLEWLLEEDRVKLLDYVTNNITWERLREMGAN